MIAGTDCAFLMEDLAGSAYRLSTQEDMSDPGVAEKIALWYKSLQL
jgi:hypothetical protein